MKSARVNVPRPREQALPPVSPVPAGGSIPPLAFTHMEALLKKIKPA